MPKTNKRGGEELYSLPVRYHHETDSAVLVEDLATEERFWLPLSQIHEMERLPESDRGTIHMTAWIAKKKGLI